MQVSWIDPDELSRLAAELQSAAPPSAEGDEQGILPGLLTFVEPDGSVTLIPPFQDRPAEPINAEQTGGPNAPVAPEILHIREQLRLIRERAQQAGLLGVEHAATDATEDLPPPVLASPFQSADLHDSEPGTAVTAAHFLPLEGSMEERLGAFGRWVSRLVASDELVLIDDRGEMIWSSGERSDLTLTALLAVTSALRSHALGVCEPPEIIRNKLGEYRELSVLPCLTKHGLVSLAIVNAAGILPDTVGWLREALVLTIEGRNDEAPPL